MTRPAWGAVEATLGMAAMAEQTDSPVYLVHMNVGSELLKDESDHAHAKEEYYKIQLGGLEKLKEPITTDKWKRLTFLCSSGEYLLNAKILNDLVIQSGEREILWKSLRECAENEQLYKTDLPEVDIPPEMLMVVLGIKVSPANYN